MSKKISKRIKLISVFLIAAILLFLTAMQAVRLYHSFGRVKMPTEQSRKLSESGIYNSMTPEQLAAKFSIPQDQVFMLFGISPEPGDEKLSLRTLRKKYNKTPEEMLNALKKMSRRHE